jgi:hypothetical protein
VPGRFTRLRRKNTHHGEKERTSFLKKRSKKLLFVLASAFPDRLSPDSQKFFGSFFQKRTACFAGSFANFTGRIAAIRGRATALCNLQQCLCGPGPGGQNPAWNSRRRLLL